VAGVGDFNGDGRDDILWRNINSGENYIYPMNGAAIGPGEGYVRTVADHRWQVAGVGDLNGDGMADIVWRNTSSGDNYAYLMNGLAIQGEGHLRGVADQGWQVAGVADFDGDGRDDLFWRNRTSGENYLYPMDGVAIKPTEGYVRTVADQSWQVAQIGDFDGDGRNDVFWRNSSTGENYVYLMDGALIAGEGYVRQVADQNWQPARTSTFAVRRGALDGAQAGTGSTATGSALVRMDLWSRRVIGRIEHTPTTSDAFIAHIHVGGPGQSGAPIVFFEEVGTPNTTWTVVPGALGVMPAANALDFLAGATYVNVHTDNFAGGEIRGQLE
jgi:hypothetical protein